MTRDLSALTDKPPPRGRGLAGSLPVLRPVEPPVAIADLPTTEESESLNNGTSQAANGQDRPETPQKRQRAQNASAEKKSNPPNDDTETTGALSAVVVYLPAKLLARVKAAKIASHQAYTEWVLDQLDQNWDALAEVFVKPAARSSPLPPRGPSRRREVEVPQALQLRMTGDELRIVDARAEAVAAGSRSAFITAIAELALMDR